MFTYAMTTMSRPTRRRPPALEVDRGSSVMAFVHDKLGTLDRMAAMDEPVVRATLGPIQQWFVFDAELARVVLQTEAATYVRPTAVNKLFETVAGINLFTATGDAWSWRRRSFQPAFSRDAMAVFGPRVVRTTNAFVDRLAPGPVDDLADVLADLVLSLGAGAMFAIDLADPADAARVRASFDQLVAWTNARLSSPVSVPASLPTRRNRSMRSGRATVLAVLDRAIEARRVGGPARAPGDGDVLDAVLAARDPDGRPLTERDVRHELLALLFAGYETTAAAAAWCLARIADRPELQDAIAAVPDDDTALLDRVLDETMRLAPPAWGTARMAATTTTLGDYDLPKGTGVIVATYSIHRRATYWPDPVRFDPDRFLPSAVRARPAAAFHPFAVGPRHCLGMRLARLELQVIVRTLCRRFRLARRLPGAELPMDPVFALRIAEPLEVELTAR